MSASKAVMECLAREVSGAFSAFEPEVRRAIGNTNYILIRDLAALVLKQAEPAKAEETP